MGDFCRRLLGTRRQDGPGAPGETGMPVKRPPTLVNRDTVAFINAPLQTMLLHHPATL